MNKSLKPRDLTIKKSLLNKPIGVYNGKTSTHFIVKRAMISHKIGVFALTKYMGKMIHDSERSRKRKNKLKQKRK